MAVSLRHSLLPLVLVALFALPAGAEPWLAQREGYRCSQCHVNRTGGGKRTLFGYQWALTHLTLVATPPPVGDSPPASGLWGAIDPQLNEAVSVGANARLGNTTIFARKTHNSFEQPEADFYLQLDPTRYLTVYLDTSVAQGTVEAREAWVLASLAGFSLKGGVLLPPFGLRLWGDNEFIRQLTGYNFATSELGVELGFERRGFGAFLAATNGSGGDNQKKLSLWMEHAVRAFRMGLSGSYNNTATIQQFVGGMYVGATLGRLVLLGEADLIAAHYYTVHKDLYTLVAYAEADLQLRRGLSLKLSYGYHDPDLQETDDQRLTMRGAIEVAPIPFAIVSLSFRLGRSIPQDEVGNAGELVAELHAFF